jgi:hypothetical protein
MKDRNTMKQFILIACGVLVMANSVFGQVPIQGRVLSARTGLGVPFASVGVEKSTLGTITDSTGRFKLTVSSKTSILLVRSLGFEMRRLVAAEATRIILTESDLSLAEVQIRAINPAHRIIEQAVENLPQNDPEKIPSFRYEAYHVSTISRLKPPAKLTTPKPPTPLYVNESYSVRTFVAPGMNHEDITASRTSGTPSTLFASFRQFFQPFGFHQETISVRLPRMTESVPFLNPLSRKSAAVYDFFLADTLIHSPGDSTFVIEYEPRPGRGISGLKGVLHIRSGSFAPEYITAQPADPKTMLRFWFEQTYERVQGRWFPVGIRSMWEVLPSASIKTGGLSVETRSSFTNIQFNSSISPETFTEMSVVLADGSNRQSESFWQTHRLDSLTIDEKNTFSQQSQLRGWARFKTNMLPTVGEWAMAGMVPLNRYINLSSQTFFDANRYEGTRLTLNLLTSRAFSPVLRLDGKLSYGTFDKAVKYEGRARLLLNPVSRMYLTGAYRFDVSEPANVQFFIWNYPQIPYELLRTFLLSRADSLQQWRVELSARAMKHTTVTASVLSESRRPTYSYRFRPPEYEQMPMTNFQTTELSLGFRYAYNEQFSQIGQGSIVAQAPPCVWSFQVVQGVMEQIFGGHYAYTKLNARYEQLLRHRRLGETYINLTGGMIFGKLPYQYLYNSRGAKSDANLIWVANHFQTMGLYEFTSDRYATLFLTHNFKTLLGKPRVGWFRPEPTIIQGISYGGLHNPTWHEGIAINTLKRGFFESGLLVDNLYRQKLANVAYLGLGIGAFYRWGPNALPNPADNWAFRVVWNVGF